MKVYHVEKKEVEYLEYFIAIRTGIFGDIYYVADDFSEEINLIYCHASGFIKIEVNINNFFKFPEHFYEKLGHCAFSDIDEIFEKIERWWELPTLQGLPIIPQKVLKIFHHGLQAILESESQGC